jgi:thiol-disulfide isomerase/thioredoxin
MDPLIRVNEPAPEFALADLSGVSHRRTGALGRVLVLNFWSSDCPWAERGDEILAELKAAWGDRVEIWSIASNANETIEQLTLAAAAREPGLVLHDGDQAVADLYGAVTTPHFFVVDGKGFLRYQGALDDTSFRQRQPTRTYLKDAVDAVLAGHAPDPAVCIKFLSHML